MSRQINLTHPYQLVPIHYARPLRRHNGRIVARITVEGDAGRKNVRRVLMTAQSVAESQADFHKLQVERSENCSD